jgi:hypothetical protein
MIPLLRSYHDLRGTPERANGQVVGADAAQKYSHHVSWQRAGEKERIEERDQGAQGHLRSVTTFDGQVQRILQYKDGTAIGFIFSPQRSNWLTSNRVHPFAFLYMSFETLFSDIVEKGKDFRLERESIAGEDHVRVTVRHPAYDVDRYQLLFGKGGLLTERRLELEERRKSARQWVVREITRLSDYRRHELPEGEPIWFPHEVAISYCAGQMPDGRVVEWKSEMLQLRDVKFNVNIPDDNFTIEFPSDIRVYDGLTGQETWLEPGIRPAAVFQPQREGAKRLWWSIGIASFVALATIAALFVYARRRRVARRPIT